MRRHCVLGSVVFSLVLWGWPRAVSGEASFGFVDTPGGFAFQVTATDNPDNLVVWTDPGTLDMEILFETVEGGGAWASTGETLTPAEVQQEALSRGLTVDEFDGLRVELKGGDDILNADGGGTFGILPGATVGPTAVPDPLTGTPLDVDGGGGNDQLFGSDDEDTIRGGEGDDIIDGFRGSDVISGGNGDDVLFGGANDSGDVLSGGPGNDFLDGENGSDTLLGGPGRDDLRTEYDPAGAPGTGAGNLVDLVLGGLRGGDGPDDFEIRGTGGSADEIDAGAELIRRIGFSDFVGSEDSVSILPGDVGAGGPYFVRDGGPLPLNAVRPTGKNLVTYEWDLDNDGVFDDATGVNPLVNPSNVATFFPDPKITYEASVRVTDTVTMETKIAFAEVRNAAGPYITITDVRAPEGDSGEAEFTFTVNLGSAAAELLTFEFSTENGAPASGLTGPLRAETSFEDAQALSAAGRLVHQDGSPPHEGDELISFHPPFCSSWHWHRLDLDLFIGCGHSLVYAIELAANPAVGSSDFVPFAGAAAIQPGESSTTITVPVKGDRLQEPDELFRVNLLNPSVGTIVDGMGIGTILNDDVNGVPGPGGGFFGMPGQFGYRIVSTLFTDNVVLWTDSATLDTEFFVEWRDDAGTWNFFEGSFSEADVMQEAQDRGMTTDDFSGVCVKLDEGDDTFRADGSGVIGVLPGATTGPTAITDPFIGQKLKVFGNDGDDDLLGSPGDDTLLGGRGDDTIRGWQGNDTLSGEEGRDALVGGTGDDQLSGGDDDDVLVGSGAESRDVLDGGDGNDLIDGGRGEDLLIGGAGNDLLLGEYNDGGLPNSGLGELVDTRALIGLFGEEGQDEFLVRGTSGANDEFDVQAELDAALTFGRTDIDFADDRLGFDRPPNGPAVTRFRRLPSNDLLIEWNGTSLGTSSSPGGPFTPVPGEEPGVTIQAIDDGIDAHFFGLE